MYHRNLSAHGLTTMTAYHSTDSSRAHLMTTIYRLCMRLTTHQSTIDPLIYPNRPIPNQTRLYLAAMIYELSAYHQNALTSHVDARVKANNTLIRRNSG